MTEFQERSSPRFVARWDLDKTYLRTDFDTFRDLLRTAFERPDEKRTVPGAASLLRELSAAGGQIHILSGSPRQMRGRIEEKLRLDGARFDSLTLKPNLENILKLRFRAIRDQLGYKLPALLRSRLNHSSSVLPEVLLGDDAEADAFVYSLYADVCAGLIPNETLARILELGHTYEDSAQDALQLARQIPSEPCVRRILIHLEHQSPPSRFAAYGPRVVPFYNYLQAALILAEDDILPPGGVVRVAAEMVLEHRFDAEGLARSYLELRRRGCVKGDLVPVLQEAISHLAQGTRFPAQEQVEAMCSLLLQRLPSISPSPWIEDRPRDYLSLVVSHNPRQKRRRR